MMNRWEVNEGTIPVGAAELREGGDKRAHETIARLRREMQCEGGAQ